MNPRAAAVNLAHGAWKALGAGKRLAYGAWKALGAGNRLAHGAWKALGAGKRLAAARRHALSSPAMRGIHDEISMFCGHFGSHSRHSMHAAAPLPASIWACILFARAGLLYATPSL
jgi:hypothetical protein